MEEQKDKQKELKKTILIVEDHDALRDSLKVWLSSVFQDCFVLLAKTGEEALDTIQSQQPDIVLMDVMLPQMNGIETARRMKKSFPSIHVVMLSIYEDAAYKTDAAAAGASEYIPKRKMGKELIPFLTKLLQSSINHSTQRSE